MVNTRMMYILSDERELPYGGYMVPDAAYFIGNKEIRLPIPGGYRLFEEKEIVNLNAPKPQTNPNLEALIQKQGEQITSLQNALDKLLKEAESNANATSNSERNSIRNAF